MLTLTRNTGDRTEFVLLSFWERLEDIAAFAGSAIEHAVFYPEDDRFLVERDLRVTHYEMAGDRAAGNNSRTAERILGITSLCLTPKCLQARCPC